ncbi:glutamate-gated chloride channel-like [Schistocerca cancellata]|uniref:glutamate-gated chloride channel-like n=1 Tax=Schistocerca cancellata TaxID=274614 RepID=UPI002118CEDB|nr:glutamate-gated chloride channel-like [Schistocerca cancellata]
MMSAAPSKSWRFCALVLLAVNLPQVICADQKTNVREAERQVMEHVLSPSRYDARLRPPGYNGTESPTVVKVNIFVRSISRIDDQHMEYDAQLTFREQWLDDRLKFDDYGGKIKYLTLTDPSRIWMPDLFFSNEKKAHFHDVVMPNVYVRIFPLGSVLYSTRISMTLSCPMDLRLYPHDRQVCSIRMASYGWTTDDLVFMWKDGDPVQVVRNLRLPRFTLEKFLTDYCHARTNTGEYSCLKVELVFKREFRYYMVHIYIPTFMLVIVSWLSFWLDQRAITARTCLVVTTVLTITIQTSGVRASLPVVNYVMAVEVWLGMCVAFVFGALLQLALVNYLARSEARRGAAKRHSRLVGPEHSAQLEEITEALVEDGSAAFAMKLLEEQSNSATADKEAAAQGGRCSPRQWWRAWTASFPTGSQRADAASRVLFPLAFSLFCLVYWCVNASG